MVEHDANTVRTVAWSEVFPWLRIVRVFRLAIAARALLLGAAGILLTASGWALIGGIFGEGAVVCDSLCEATACPWQALAAAVPNQPGFLNGMETGVEQERFDPSAAQLHNPISDPWKLLTLPALEGLSSMSPSWSVAATVLLCGVWSIAVWAFFGAAICRIAAVQLAASEQVGWGAVLRFAARKWPSYCAAPLLPLGGVLLAAIPVFVLGLIIRADALMILGGLLWPLALAAGLLMTLLLAGLLFGWPLMWGAISAEGTDSFDALSRSYAYVFQRPLHYLFYVLAAGLIGWLGWVLVQNIAAGVVWMSYWAAGWGCGSAQIDAVMYGGDELGRVGGFGAGLIRFFADCVKLLAVGYLFSYFWTAAAAIYFLLRRDVDATEMDEVYLDADQSEPAFDLPQVATDEAGAPVAEE